MDRQLSDNKVWADGSLPIGGSVAEVSVLLETEQLAIFEAAACAQGLTAGALLRCLLRDYLTGIESEVRAARPGAGAPDSLEASACSLAECTDIWPPV